MMLAVGQQGSTREAGTNGDSIDSLAFDLDDRSGHTPNRVWYSTAGKCAPPNHSQSCTNCRRSADGDKFYASDGSWQHSYT
jgi:hypothetical protein